MPCITQFFVRLLLGLGFFMLSGVMAVGSQEAVYGVRREGIRIGEFRFSMEGEAGRQTISVDMTVTIKVLFVTVYRATHQRRDLWEKGALTSSEGTSSYNGKKFEMKFWRAEGRGLLRANGETREVDDPVMTLVPWRPAVSGPVNMLSEKGKADRVTLSFERRETIQVGGENVEAEKFQLAGRKSREVWYDAQGTLLRVRYESHGTMIDLERETPLEKKQGG